MLPPPVEDYDLSSAKLRSLFRPFSLLFAMFFDIFRLLFVELGEFRAGLFMTSQKFI